MRQVYSKPTFYSVDAYFLPVTLQIQLILSLKILLEGVGMEISGLRSN